MARQRSEPEPKPEPEQAAPAPKEPPAMPTQKTATSSALHEKMVVLYGPPGVGKTTLASQWAGGDGFFFNTAGELGDIEVYQESVRSWEDFRRWAWGLASVLEKANEAKKDLPYPCAVIDTLDALGRYCGERTRKKLGIAHESDLDYGKGWQALRDEFAVNIAKLSAMPNFGLVIVAHSDERKVKLRSREIDKWMIRGVKAVRETVQDMSDLILFIDFDEEDETKRVIRTKPTINYDAKERGNSPRLPATIEWPFGENGWELLKAVWEGSD